MRLFEVSSNTELGSWSKDLVESKRWLAEELYKINNHYPTVYVLGSWYGNASILLFQENKLSFDWLYNVDVDRQALKQGQELANELGMTNIIPLLANANDIVYKRPNLVINTSCNNMENAGWFENIPHGTLVALQSRNNDPAALNQHNTPRELLLQYPLAEVIYEDKKRLHDKQGSYARFMVIGYK